MSLLCFCLLLIYFILHWDCDYFGLSEKKEYICLFYVPKSAIQNIWWEIIFFLVFIPSTSANSYLFKNLFRNKLNVAVSSYCFIHLLRNKIFNQEDKKYIHALLFSELTFVLDWFSWKYVLRGRIAYQRLIGKYSLEILF